MKTFLIHMGEVQLQLFRFNNETEAFFDMLPVVDLIVEQDGQPITHTTQAADAFDAWRLGREH